MSCLATYQQHGLRLSIIRPKSGTSFQICTMPAWLTLSNPWNLQVKAVSICKQQRDMFTTTIQSLAVLSVTILNKSWTLVHWQGIVPIVDILTSSWGISILMAPGPYATWMLFLPLLTSLRMILQISSETVLRFAWNWSPIPSGSTSPTSTSMNQSHLMFSTNSTKVSWSTWLHGSLKCAAQPKSMHIADAYLKIITYSFLWKGSAHFLVSLARSMTRFVGFSSAW